MAWLAYGDVLVDLDRFADAKAAYERARLADVHCRRIEQARAALVAEDRKTAETLFREILRSDASHVGALCGLAAVSLGVSRGNDALRLLKHALKQSMHLPLIWRGLCQTFLDLARLPEAEEAARYLLKIEPENPKNWVTLGNVYTRLMRQADALVAFEDRSEHKLKQVHPDILIAENGKAIRSAEIIPRGPRQPEIFIIEYTADRAIADITPKRSSRIIARFHDPGLEHDAQFEALSIALANKAGAGLISGFNSIPYDRIDKECAEVTRMTQQWRAAGLQMIHLELAGYDTPSHRDRVIERLQGSITSIGMSHSEFVQLVPEGKNLEQDMCDLGDRFELKRVCVHADHWAASATKGDAEEELLALMMGCLIAGTRARHGVPANPQGIDARATFTEPPLPLLAKHGSWSIISCASPHLEHPAATVGLGDSFTGGCLLMLGKPAERTTITGIRHGTPVKAG